MRLTKAFIAREFKKGDSVRRLRARFRMPSSKVEAWLRDYMRRLDGLGRYRGKR